MSTCGGGRRGVSEVENEGEGGGGDDKSGATASSLTRPRGQCRTTLITPSVDAIVANARMCGARQRLGLRRRARVLSTGYFIRARSLRAVLAELQYNNLR